MIGLENGTALQPPAAGIVLVTEYDPGALAVKSTCPVAVLTKLSPAGEDEKVPA